MLIREYNKTPKITPYTPIASVANQGGLGKMTPISSSFVP